MFSNDEPDTRTATLNVPAPAVRFATVSVDTTVCVKAGTVYKSTSILTADLHKNNYAATKMTQFYKDYEPAFRDFLKETGKSTNFIKYNYNDRLEFARLVANATRGEGTELKSIQRGAEASKKLFKNFLDDGKKYNVKGMEDIIDSFQ